MTAPATTGHRRANALDRPRFFDRQLLAAADLALEQGFGDRRFALFRANVIGWGVAAGLRLDIQPAQDGEGGARLTVSPGYGLTPLGTEVYLDEPVTFDDIATLVRGQCCGGAHDCTDVTPAAAAPSAYEIALEARRRAAAEAAAIAAGQPAGGTAPTETPPITANGADDAGDATCRAWVVARPAPQAGALRPSMPEGCGHPGNAMKPSRTCGGARIDIVCALTAPHDTPPADSGLQALICDPWGPALDHWPDAADYVVLGRVDLNDGVRVGPADRRRIARLDLLSRLACLDDAPRPGGTIGIDAPLANAVIEISPAAGVIVEGGYSVTGTDAFGIVLSVDGQTVEAAVDRTAQRYRIGVALTTAGARRLTVQLVARPGGEVLATAARDIEMRAAPTGTLAIDAPQAGSFFPFSVRGTNIVVNGRFSSSEATGIAVIVSSGGNVANAQLIGNNAWGANLVFTTTGTKQIVAQLVRTAGGVELARDTRTITLGFVTIPPGQVPIDIGDLPVEVVTQPPHFDPLGPRADDLPIIDALRDVLPHEVEGIADRLETVSVHTVGALANMPVESVAEMLAVTPARAQTIVDTARVRTGRAIPGALR